MTGAEPLAAAGPIVLKLGGELIEPGAHLPQVVAAIAAISSRQPLVVVHGGGKEIDAALRTAGIPTQQVDGLRITDGPTLDVVVSVLAGTVNTRFVAALGAAGVAAVGLTGADAFCGLAEPAGPHRAVDGRLVDLGQVGEPSAASDARLLTTLVGGGFVPVIACIGATADGRLLNVNADTLAGHLAARLRARRLIVAGTTAGVLDARGDTVPALDGAGVARLVAAGTASAGMVAKLRACEQALAGGAREVLIVDGRTSAAVALAAEGGAPAGATRVMQTMVTA